MREDIEALILRDGYYLAHDVVAPEMVARLRKDIEFAIESEAAYHGGPEHPDHGVVQLCPLYGKSFIDVLDNDRLLEPYNLVIGEGSIIYVYISSSLPPGGTNRATRIHVDRPYVFKDRVEALAGLIMLDDFTEENGATFLLPGSQLLETPPTEEHFRAHCRQITARAGSVLYFNMRLWHSAGVNKTSEWRHAIAIGAVPPFYKQKFDIPKALEKNGTDMTGVTPKVLQKLGYYAIPPTTLDEYYIPEKRTYLQASEWPKE